MKLAALISGGKDSIFNILHCIANGHELSVLLNLAPPPEKEELDSFMFQTVGTSLVSVISKAMNIPLIQHTITGNSLSIDAEYEFTDNDEVEDLYLLIKTAKEEFKIDGVSVGAILSNYQRLRVENVCERLGLRVYAYLWQFDQVKLLESLVECGFDVMVVKVSGMGLKSDLLGKKIDFEFIELMKDLSDKWGTHPAGEGGEYETIVLDCPLFKKRIEIDEFKVVTVDDCSFSTVAYATNFNCKLVDKDEPERLKSLEKAMKLFRDQFCYKTPIGSIDDQNSDLSSSLIPSDSFKTPIVQYKLVESEGNILLTGISLSSIGLDPANCDFTQEAETLFEFALKTLNQNSVFTDVILCQVTLKDMSKFTLFNSIYKKYFPKFHPACRTCIENKFQFSHNKGNIILEFSTSKNVTTTKKLHVQSISYWAPANIGPYSQSIIQGKRVIMSGQIGLVPETMSLGTINDQLELCIRNVKIVFETTIQRKVFPMDGSDSCTFKATGIIYLVICYVSSESLIDKCKSKIENEFKCICLCVVVSGLPMNAMVELHPFGYLGDVEFNVKKVKRRADNAEFEEIYINERLVSAVACVDDLKCIEKFYDADDVNCVTNETLLSDTTSSYFVGLESKFAAKILYAMKLEENMEY